MKSKIVFTDLDGTIIRTKSGRVFPTNYNDWVLKKGVVNYISQYVAKGYMLILVTNQGGIKRGLVKRHEFDQKLIDIQTQSGLRFDKIVIADSMKSPYRKPLSDALVKDLKKEGITIDKENSVMIGDAGGRRTDFSDSDMMFAHGLGIEFIHAETL